MERVTGVRLKILGQSGETLVSTGQIAGAWRSCAMVLGKSRVVHAEEGLGAGRRRVMHQRGDRRPLGLWLASAPAIGLARGVGSEREAKSDVANVFSIRLEFF